jgi:hypothetical protein
MTAKKSKPKLHQKDDAWGDLRPDDPKTHQWLRPKEPVRFADETKEEQKKAQP